MRCGAHVEEEEADLVPAEAAVVDESSSITLTTTDFWIRIHDLPLICHTMETIEVMALRIGKLVAYENPSIVEPNEFMRIKLLVNVTKPLRHGLNICFEGAKLWISFTYEALPAFCFCCGVIGHFYKSCKFVDRDLEADPKEFIYGTFLKADVMRRQKGF
ncbi:hypothetical protein ACS0TY_024787 [Phlomoides rotata]